MDFHDEKFLEILKSNTVTRENNGLFVDLILDDDRNYHNDELLLCMGDHSKIKKIAGKNGKDSEYALKIIKVNWIHKDFIDYFDLIQNEIKIIKRLEHPNIIILKDFFKDKKYFYLVYELAEYGNLLNYYRKTETFTENDVFQMFFQILLAVDYIHKSRIIHRNLKLQNILIDIQNNLKLSNFKHACEEENISKLSKEFLEENLPYLPPEVILSQPYNHKSDIWGLGIILYELLSKTSPFNGIIIEHTIHNILNSTTLIKGKLSEPLKNLLSHLLSKDPSERPSTEEILRHEWIVMNLQRHDISFLKHPAFRNCHKLGDLLKYSKKEDSSELKKSYDIRKITFFKKNNSQHEVFLHKRSEEEMQRFPNIFHDGYFNRSYTQKSLNKSINEVKNQSLYSISPIRQTKIFEPMRQAYKNVNVNNINNYNNSSRKEYNKKNNYNDNINNDSEEYELIQHLNERHSIGNQEEQRFSHPVLVEKRKKNHNMQKNSGVYQENSKNLNKSQNSLDKGNDISLKMENKDTKSKFFKRNDVSERSQNHTQNDMSGYSTKSNNQKLYFDHDFNDKD